MKPNFKLRFDKDDILYWANRYSFDSDDEPTKIGRTAKEKGILSADQLFKLCQWKSSRKAAEARKNSELTVREITRFSFSTPDNYCKISSLILLKGVQWPTASVILHFCLDDDLPILDVRAIWSLGKNKPSSYNYEYWEEYVSCCQAISKENNVSVRTLDKALWQFSKENQKNIL